MTRQSTIERRRALFKEATAIIEREFARELELDDVARRVATSRRQLLAEGSLPVRDVARRVGYRQPAQFAKAFRRRFGAPPSRFRPGGDSVAA